MNNNLEFENTDPSPDSIEDNHPRTNYGKGWIQERMYSEEEVYHILVEHTAFLFQGGKSTLSEWFEQFKKK
jgi:hypothetical protein